MAGFEASGRLDVGEFMVRASGRRRGRVEVGEFMVWATGRLQGDGIMGLGDWQAAGGWDHGSGRLAK